ncbi:cobyric acid synthase [Geoalkalibacter halelectricus]|uniref:Cobyric acid synthase n=1 Tax=Geoalkalibacter halelectricus TaxID=2847045 RepID=A0ABY5ZQ24_9BACT|nr:cobyric acid synthase [Geoalkalibacter halelectricus]MDO3377533.1 cobyric acid synthase [Geoalkalibacter halelectricus]UWZ80708.1 cobyric acid synthase [Geoalkalibacter halelectricus]
MTTACPRGKLFILGLGPGGLEHLTPAAREALARAQVVVGYRTYLDLVAPLLEGKQVVDSGMRQEVERARQGLDLAAAGHTVALISSGDAGIYGMAGLVLELAQGCAVAIEVIPGVSAVQAAAAALGAPLMHDFAVISLSDLLTPWELIRHRLDAAGRADFVVALYNPRSHGRVTQLDEARRILLRHRRADTPVGIVRHAGRSEQQSWVAELGTFDDSAVDMSTLVIVGNSSTFVDDAGRMVTPRGYANRYQEAGIGKRRSQDLPTTTEAGQANTRALFVGGTGSDVGKSVITSGLCRLFRRRGLSVAPFKAQNMALNSAVTPEGGEIGRAQALQAAACGLEPHTDMNPILLKPNSETGSQVIIQGRVLANMTVRDYHAFKPQAFARVRESFARLAAAHELVVMEGAGSIAEINLREHDITNLKAAALAQAPVLLVADIDRGGVFAAILGTLELLRPEERAQIAGVIINRFRGDASLLAPGIAEIEERTGVPVLGVVPWIDLRLPQEDSVALARKRCAGSGRPLRIAVVRLPRLSNYTDFDPLENEPDVDLLYVTDPGQLAGCDLIILPGSKNTLEDLAWLDHSGLSAALRAHHRGGGRILGVCGGYQMLGVSLSDPHGMESARGTLPGLGLLEVTTVLHGEKQTHRVEARPLPAARALGLEEQELLHGYEIHLGETRRGPRVPPLLRLTRRTDGRVVEDGAMSADGRVWGCYLHGLFDNPPLRRALLAPLRRARRLDEPSVAATCLDSELDRLADHLAAHLDLARIGALLHLDLEEHDPCLAG